MKQRKSVATNDNPLTFRCDVELRERLDWAVKRAGSTRSDIIRFALLNWLDDNELMIRESRAELADKED